MIRFSRHIRCPRCEADVRIPWFWILGLEGIFRCKSCRQPFKTGYKMGAFLSALGLCLSMAVVQGMVYLLSIYSMPIFVLLLIPLWILFAFLLRKAWMLHRVRQAVRLTPQTPEKAPSATAVTSPDQPQKPEDEYLSLQKLPDDTPFEEEEADTSPKSASSAPLEDSEDSSKPVIKNPFTGETF